MELKLSKLVWDEFNTAHIAKHHVTVDEVEEACQTYIYIDETYGHRYLLVGKSKAGRLISVVLSKKLTGYYIVTARDSSRGERKKAHDQESK